MCLVDAKLGSKEHGSPISAYLEIRFDRDQVTEYAHWSTTVL